MRTNSPEANCPQYLLKEQVHSLEFTCRGKVITSVALLIIGALGAFRIITNPLLMGSLAVGLGVATLGFGLASEDGLVSIASAIVIVVGSLGLSGLMSSSGVGLRILCSYGAVYGLYWGSRLCCNGIRGLRF